MRLRNSYYLTSVAWTAWLAQPPWPGRYAKDGGRYDF